MVGAIGEAAQQAAAADHPTVDATDCMVCEGSFTDAERWLEAALTAADAYEFGSFQVGTLFPTDCEEAEKALVLQEDMTDTIRTEANRWLGPRIAEATGAAWQTQARPDVAILVDTRFWSATVTANSVYMAGRYTKHRRDVPQTHWPCKTCQGPGCYKCDDTGVMYPSSVEDETAARAVPLFGADGAAFHGAGREDIDALMLGSGRPFVLELKGPRRRNVDLRVLADAINAGTHEHGVGVADLRMTDKAEVAAIKGAEYDKQYVAHCIAEGPVSADALAKTAAACAGIVLEQRTPERVAHRRADKVRGRTVREVTVEDDAAVTDGRFSIGVRAESGTYIKEFVSGDDGRTVPSFSELLGVPCRVEFLDVVSIQD